MSLETALTHVVAPTVGEKFVAYGRPPVPGYELLGELGRGGMGVVYKARQAGLNRIVALKMVLGGVQLHESDRVRFLAEAEAVAAIKHPNVVQVYEYGQNQGLPYFAMEFVEGGSLARALLEFGPMPAFAAARLLAQVARGVQAAHDVGVVHRDLKPANILLAVDGGQQTVDSSENDPERSSLPTVHSSPTTRTAKVTDFGIAKRGGGMDLTVTGMVMGTPAYMAPEQASGNAKFVGPGADVYALGVILFECLTGRTPFTAADSQSLLIQVVQKDAPLVRSIAPKVPQDLELICAKCLAKAPHERYPSAAALAADLERFALGEPVSVRPPGRLEKAVRWVRKYPTRAAVYGLAFLAIALGGLAGGAVSLWRGAENSRTQAVIARGEAEAQRGKAETARGEADEARGKAETAKVEADEARGRALLALGNEKQARAGESKAQHDLAVEKAAHDVDLAFREYEANNVVQARELLAGCPPECRTWEWRHLDRLCRREVTIIPTNTPELWGLAFAPDTEGLLTSTLTEIYEWNPTTGEKLKTIKGGGNAIALSGNGKRIAAMGLKHLSVYERADGQLIKNYAITGKCVALNPDGSRVLVCHPGQLVVDLTTSVTTRLTFDDVETWCGTFSSDGETIAVGGRGKTPKLPPGVVKVWPKGREPIVIPIHPEAPVRSIAIDPTGQLLAAGCEDGTIVVRALAGGQVFRKLRGHTSMVSGLAFDPTGKRLVSGSTDRTVRVWDVDFCFETRTFKGHENAVTSVAFTQNGKRVASVGLDGTARVWNAEGPQEATQLANFSPPPGPVPAGIRTQARDARAIAVTDDGTRAILAIPGGPVQAFNTENGALVWPKLNRGGFVHTLTLGTNGQLITGVGLSGERREWELLTGDERPVGKKFAVKQPASISADLSRAITLDKHNWTVTISDAWSGIKIASTGKHVAPLTPPTISPDGRRVLTAGLDRKLMVWDADTGNKLFEMTGHVGYVRSAAFSPDGLRIATVGQEGWVKLWDAKTGREVLTFRGPSPDMVAVNWSPDGSKLIALDERGIIHVRDGGAMPVELGK